jgi:glyoxylase-like metal-dependent hydrolase (beta-lactamase superfamily II)
MFAILLAAILLLLSGCSSAPPTGPEAARALIDESATAIGGWAVLDAVKSQEMITAGGDWEPMQAVKPDGEPRIVNKFGQTLLIDFEKKRMRLVFDALRQYPAPGPVKFTEVIDGEVAMLQTTDAQGKVTSERLHPSRYAARVRDLNRLPIRLLYVARNAPDLTRVADRIEGRDTLHILRYKDGSSDVEVHINSFNKLPVRVIYTEDDPIYGDTLNEWGFSDWREYGEVRLPQTYSIFLNGRKIREERVRTLINNPKYEEASFAIPEEVRSQPENGERVVSQWTLRRAVMGVGYQDFARPQKTELVALAPGVYHVTGSTHHSMAVEMKDHIVVVEAPLYEERSAAVIQALEEKIPGKPIRYAVITHFHIDHSGGMRTYAAKGATLVAHESIGPFIKEVLGRPKTVRPDELAKAGGNKGAVETVSDVKTLSDGERTLELRQVPNGHSEGMLMAYLPKERLVFVSDLYSPGNPIDPANPNVHAFYTAVTGAKMDVDRVVGGHGTVGPFRDLVRAMSAAAKPKA